MALTTQAPRGGPPASLWQRDFTLLWAGSAASELGGMAAQISYPLLCLAQTGSPVLAGWVAFAAAAPKLLLQLPAGVLVDRLDRRRTMLVSQAIRCAAVGLLAITLVMGAGPAWLLVAVAAVDGSFAVLYDLAETAAVPQIVPAERLTHAFSRNEARLHAALTLGRPLGGLLFGIQRALPFIADALSSLVSLLTLACMKTKALPPSVDVPRGDRHFLRELRDGFAWLSRDAFLRLALMVSGVSNLLFQIQILLLIVIATESGFSSLFIGVLLTSSGVGGLIGSYAAPKVLNVIGPVAVHVVGTWTWLAISLSILTFHQPMILLMSWSGVGLMGALTSVASGTYLATTAPPEILGRAGSVGRFIALGGVPIGALGGGYAISTLGTNGASLLVVIAMALLALAVTDRARPKRRRPRETERQAVSPKK